MKMTFSILLIITFVTSCGVMHPPGLVGEAKKSTLTPNQKIISEIVENADQDRKPLENSVGVLPFQESEQEGGLGLAATEFFSSNITLVDRFQLIDMAYSHLLEMEYKNYSPEKKRRALRAEQLVRGNVILNQNDLDVAGYGYHEGTGDFTEFGYREGSARDFFRLVADLNIAFFEKNGIVVTKELADKLYRIPTEKIQAYILYARARYYEYLGNFELAKTTYSQAAAIDPEMKEVSEALEEIGDTEQSRPAKSNAVPGEEANREDMNQGETKIEEIPIDTSPSFEEKNVPIIAPRKLKEPPPLPDRQ